MAQITYDAPTSNEVLSTSLQQNQALSANPDVLNQVNALLGINPQDPTGSTVIQSFNGSGTVQPIGGQAPNMLVIEGVNPDQPIVITGDTLGQYANTIRFYSFDGPLLFDPAVHFSVQLTSDIVMTGGGGNDTIVGALYNDTIVSGANHDTELAASTILGGGGDDSIVSGAGDDSISGDAGDDSIVAGAGDDSIVAGQGYDTIDGGTGWDMVSLPGSPSEFQPAEVIGNRVVLNANLLDAYGVNVTNVDFIQAGSEGSWQQIGGEQSSWVVVDNQYDLINERFFQGLLNRSADDSGAQFWAQNAAAGGLTNEQVANAFMSSPEFAAKWGVQTNEQFVEQLYNNALMRDADQGGLDFWTGLLDQGVVSRASIAVAIVGSQEADGTIGNVILVDGLL